MRLKLFLFAEKNIDDLKKELEVNDHRLSPEELYKKYQVLEKSSVWKKNVTSLTRISVELNDFQMTFTFEL